VNHKDNNLLVCRQTDRGVGGSVLVSTNGGQNIVEVFRGHKDDCNVIVNAYVKVGYSIRNNL
jgi:hypothetical protein